MKAITTGAVILSLAAITGCAMHDSDGRYSNRDRSQYGQDGTGYNRTDGNHRPGMDARHDSNWNSSDKSNRQSDWRDRKDNNGNSGNNRDWNNRNNSNSDWNNRNK